MAPYSFEDFLPIHNAQDFSKFSHAFGYKPHEIIGIVVNRPLLAPNISPANESPKEVLIYDHNESPQVPHAPGNNFIPIRELKPSLRLD
ncbi:hypothetical protein N7486_010836 [Penicillium sp. IBT 16267x]|nr:hypothetical protein N7486_010836 [Penicillium sp. IBT 16267x]